MSLHDLLSAQKSLILGRWLDEVLSTYPSDTTQFIKKTENRFANPVGHALTDTLGKVFDALLSDASPEELTGLLDTVIRVRAVQDFTPSQAVAFVFTLKKVIRDELSKDPNTPLPHEELSGFEKRVDACALVAFDIFVKCKEKLYDIRANEMNKMTYRLLKRANMLCAEDDAAGPAGDVGVNIKQEEVTK
ncbi:MAG: RsbRD N-terminal domain-containing protein [Thermodesulfovibrionales bacterium]